VRVVNTYSLSGGQGQLGLRPGRHEIHLRAPGYQEATWERDFLPGARVERRVSLASVSAPPAPVMVEPPPPPSMAAPIVVTGVGAALLAAGTVTGLVALHKTNLIAQACPGNRCPASYNLDGARANASPYVHATDGLLLGGGLVTLVGLTWLGVRLAEKPDSAAASLRQLPAVGCSTTGCEASWRVSFLESRGAR
jgi:hypothetical protein